MTDLDLAQDSRASYLVWAAAERMRLVVAGDVLPRAPSAELPHGEPIDLFTLLAIAAPRCRCEKWRPGICCRDAAVPESREIGRAA